MASGQQTTSTRLQDYESLELIAEGGFGRVYSAVHKPTQTTRAIKHVKKNPKLEATILEYLNKDDPERVIVKYHGMFPVSEGYVIVCDLLWGDLKKWSRLCHPEGPPLSVLQTIGTRLLSALQFLGKRGILHGDMKSQNCLLQTPNPASLRLCDFGFAKHVGSEYSIVPVVFPRKTALRGCRAPEVIIQYGSTYAMSPDVWAVGCILLELVFLRHIFWLPPFLETEDVLIKASEMLGKPPVHMLQQAKQTELCERLRMSTTFPQNSEPLKTLLTEELHKNQGQELNLVEEFYGLLCGLLSMDPATRLRPAQALQHQFFHSIELN